MAVAVRDSSGISFERTVRAKTLDARLRGHPGAVYTIANCSSLNVIGLLSETKFPMSRIDAMWV